MALYFCQQAWSLRSRELLHDSRECDELVARVLVQAVFADVGLAVHAVVPASFLNLQVRFASSSRR
jgi:hypothetical protein